MGYFKGKQAVITGAGSGIGRALAVQLNRQGCELWLGDINEAALAETKALLQDPTTTCHSLHLDVADRAAVHALAEAIALQVGHVDLVVNNAGVGLGCRVDEMRYEDLEWLMNINFWGVVHGTLAFLPLLKKAEQGHLVNISSVFGMVGIPTQSAYNAAKFAVRGFTESLRQEMAGSKVHVCCVHPGGIKTNIARNARTLDPDSTPDERAALFEKAARTTADSAAEQILRAAQKRKKRLMIGTDAKYLSLISRLFPVAYPSFIPGLGDLLDSVSAPQD